MVAPAGLYTPSASMWFDLVLVLILWITLPLDLDLYALSARWLFLLAPGVLIAAHRRGTSSSERLLLAGLTVLMLGLGLELFRALRRFPGSEGLLLRTLAEGLLPWWYSLWHNLPLLAPSPAIWLDRSTFVSHLFTLPSTLRSATVYVLGWWPAFLTLPLASVARTRPHDAGTVLGWSPVFAALAAALWTGWVLVSGDTVHLPASRPLGPAAPVDMLAESLALGVLASLFQASIHVRRRTPLLLLAGVLFTALLLTRSLGLVLATGVSGAVFLGVRSFSGRRKRLVLILMAGGLGIFLYPKSREALDYLLHPERAVGSPLDQGSFQPRWLRWKAALRCFRTHPLTGCGSEGLYLQARAEARRTESARGLQTELGLRSRLFRGMAGSLHATHAHNTFLDTAGRGGLVGLGLLGFWIYTLFAASAGIPRRFEAWTVLGFLLLWSLTDDPMFFRWRLIPVLALWSWAFTVPHDR